MRRFAPAPSTASLSTANDSLRSQRDHRVDAAGAAGGDPAGEEGDREEREGDEREVIGSEAPDAVEEALQQAGASEGGR